MPDLLVGYNGRNYLLEVKSPGGRLTPAQVEWLGLWQGNAAIVSSPEEALAAIGLPPKDRTE